MGVAFIATSEATRIIVKRFIPEVTLVKVDKTNKAFSTAKFECKFYSRFISTHCYIFLGRHKHIFLNNTKTYITQRLRQTQNPEKSRRKRLRNGSSITNGNSPIHILQMSAPMERVTFLWT